MLTQHTALPAEGRHFYFPNNFCYLFWWSEGISVSLLKLNILSLTHSPPPSLLNIFIYTPATEGTKHKRFHHKQ